MTNLFNTRVSLESYQWIPDVLTEDNNDRLDWYIGTPRYESEEYADGFGVARRGEYSIHFEPSSVEIEFDFPSSENEEEVIPLTFKVKNEYETDGRQSTTRTVEFVFTLTGVNWTDRKRPVVSYEPEWSEV